MARPQRHRLLHGYPMAPLLGPSAGHDLSPRRLDPDPARALIVGVLPHTFCNPRVRGCGFCTFPHERHSNEAARTTTLSVAREIGRAASVYGDVLAPKGRAVRAVYIGGGTANLTPPDAFDALLRALTSAFDLGEAEVTLEGAAVYFLARDRALLDLLESMNAGHRRLSVGVQTFDRSWLERMGRVGFGDERVVAEVVRAAKSRGMTISCDLLYNLPGRSLEEEVADILRAIALGFDQICLYNLVLDPSIDAEWAHDRSLLVRRAAPQAGAERWLALRELMLSHGYAQTTLTNFERPDRQRFVYEVLSFDPSRTDALGFGPGAISTVTARDHRSTVKWTNEATSSAYVDAMRTSREDEAPRARFFEYEPIDQRLLFITRSLSALSIDRVRYRQIFETDIADDFTDELRAIESRRLVTLEPAGVRLTPLGMFFADAVGGLLAARRVRLLRGSNDAIAHAMG